MKNALIIIISLGVGFASAWFLMQDRPVETNVPPEQISLERVNASNTFFAFLDTFVQPDSGVVDILFMKPASHLIAFWYPTGQESASAGVYNYETDTLYKNIGNSSPDSTDTPIAFIGDDRLLDIIYGEDEDEPQFIVRDFLGKKVADVADIISKEYSYFNQAYGYDDTDGKIYIMMRSTEEHSPETKYVTYVFDEMTYTFNSLSSV